MGMTSATSPQRNLVVGTDGLLGTALRDQLLAQDQPVLGTTRDPNRVSRDTLLLDLSHPSETWQLPDDIDVAYLCAAVTRLETCRTDPTRTAAINVTATSELARRLVQAGAFVVVLSSNRVFDGMKAQYRTSDPPCPTTEYGRQKVELETRVSELGTHIGVVRLTKVIHPAYPLFVQWAQDLSRGIPIHPHAGVAIAPVTRNTAVDALLAVGLASRTGTTQVSGDRDVPYVDIAHRLAELQGADPGLVNPVNPSESGIAIENIAAHESLDTTSLESLSISPPGSWEALEMCLQGIPHPGTHAAHA